LENELEVFSMATRTIRAGSGFARYIWTLAAACCLFSLTAIPASAGSTGPAPILTCVPGAGPCQETDHFSQLQFLGGPLNCGYFSGWSSVQVTGEGIQHINVNGAQDFWETSTFTGAAVISPILVQVTPNPPPAPPTITMLGPDPNRPVLTGHLQSWFGFQGNQNNFSESGTANVQATSADGTSYSLHLNDHLNSTGNNPFVPHTIVMDVSC
jgi:hypothetical protein